MPVVVIHLIPGKKEEVRLDVLQVIEDIGLGDVAAMGGGDRIAGKRGNNDFVLIGRVATDQPFIDRGLAVPHAVRHVPARVPVLDPKWGDPAGRDHLGPRDLSPLAVALGFQPHRARITLIQRVKLGRQLQHAVVYRIEGKGNDLVLGDLGDFQGKEASFGLRLLRLRPDRPTHHDRRKHHRQNQKRPCRPQHDPSRFDLALRAETDARNTPRQTAPLLGRWQTFAVAKKK
jgi:hypothetical protein